MPAVNDEFRAPAISTDGTIIAAGLPTSVSVTGAVVIFAEVGGTWQRVRELAEPVPVMGNAFGSDVALSHDGAILAVGASLADVGATDTGTAYVFD